MNATQVRRPRAERDPQPDFPRAFFHRVAQHAVNTDPREQQRRLAGKAGGELGRIVQPPSGIRHEIAETMEAEDVCVSGNSATTRDVEGATTANGSPRVRRRTRSLAPPPAVLAPRARRGAAPAACPCRRTRVSLTTPMTVNQAFSGCLTLQPLPIAEARATPPRNLRADHRDRRRSAPVGGAEGPPRQQRIPISPKKVESTEVNKPSVALA